LASVVFTSSCHYFYASAVFSKPRKLQSESELYDVALRALMRRPHSVHEMKKLLGRRASSELLAQVVLARLKENGLIDDSRYAQQFARQRTEIRRQGKFRIARDLRARGIPDSHIQAAIADSTDEIVERAAVRQRILRKLRLFRGPIDAKKIASLYRTLLAAGFPSDVIRRELKSVTADELPDVVETEE
jgi:regulatory protein